MDASARLLVGSIAIILLMGLFLVSQYAASPSMSSIKVKTEEKLVAMQVIQERGFAVEDGGADVIRVPLTNRVAILGLLENQGYAAAPPDRQAEPESSGAFMSSSERDALQRSRRVRTAEASIRMLKGVEDVRISLSGGSDRALIRQAPKPIATVTVDMASGVLDAGLASSIAMTVASVENGLVIENITVVDSRTGASHRFDEHGVGGRRDYLSTVKKWERELAIELSRLVRVSFPRAEVAINAQVLVAEIAEVESQPGKPLKVDTFVETDESSTPSAVRVGGQPGFASNSGVGPASIGRPGDGAAATRESERVLSDAKFPLTERRTDESANHPVKVAASVIIPRQEVEALLREELGPDAQIGTPEIEARTTVIQADIRKLLIPLVDSSGFRNGTPGEIEIAVMPFADWSPVATADADGGLAGSLDVIAGGDLGAALKNAGLVGLSLLSLAMMFLMVRRSGGGETLPTAEELAGVPPVLDDDTQLVGEAEEAAPAMVGVELDEEDLRRKQKLEQLNQLIKKEPSEVASLLRRWMRTEP